MSYRLDYAYNEFYTLKISNLDVFVTAGLLRKIFDFYLDDILHICIDREDGLSKGIAYVVFECHTIASIAAIGLDKKIIRGNEMQITGVQRRLRHEIKSRLEFGGFLGLTLPYRGRLPRVIKLRNINPKLCSKPKALYKFMWKFGYVRHIITFATKNAHCLVTYTKHQYALLAFRCLNRRFKFHGYVMHAEFFYEQDNDNYASHDYWI